MVENTKDSSDFVFSLLVTNSCSCQIMPSLYVFST